MKSNNKIELIKIVYLCLIFLFLIQCNNSKREYSFVKDSLNIIHNNDELDYFFSTLKSGNKKINIVHIGDSHVQLSAFPVVLRTEFQSLYGNAGRGVFAPYNVAGAGSSSGLFSSSDTYWERWNIVTPDKLNGIAGITINTSRSKASFVFKVNKKYEFNQIELFFENKADNYDLLIEDLIYGQKILVNKNISDSNIVLIKLKYPTTRVKISNIKTNPEQTHTTIFGINTSNDKNGIIYHSIGVNRAQYQHYNKAQYFIGGVLYLKPDLVIISLGTNEALRRIVDFNKEEIEEEIHNLIVSLKRQNSRTSILVTIPANFFINGNENMQVKIMREILISYCNKNKIAYWDLQEITGEASNWKDNNLFGKDMLHFNKSGYKLQGTLLFQALMNSYSQYLSKENYE